MCVSAKKRLRQQAKGGSQGAGKVSAKEMDKLDAAKRAKDGTTAKVSSQQAVPLSPAPCSH